MMRIKRETYWSLAFQSLAVKVFRIFAIHDLLQLRGKSVQVAHVLLFAPR